MSKNTFGAGVPVGRGDFNEPRMERQSRLPWDGPERVFPLSGDVFQTTDRIESVRGVRSRS